jgi:hypothetical protein
VTVYNKQHVIIRLLINLVAVPAVLTGILEWIIKVIAKRTLSWY